MTGVDDIESTEFGDEYVHVRFRDPDQFETIRTPDWAQEAAESVVSGSEVRTGKRPEADEWDVQSVLIPKGIGEEEAKESAVQIVQKIHS